MSLQKLKNSPAIRFAQTALDTILPPRCIATGDIVDKQGMISPAFWADLAFIEDPHCDTCGMPFNFNAPKGTLCAVCLEDEPSFNQARAAVIYNDASREILLNYKYGDKLHAVHTFMPWMIRTGTALLEAADIITPVPLHRKRLWQRRFNQSALLAQTLAQRSGKTYLPDALLRLRHTIPQRGMNRKERFKNVKNAFGANDKHQINGKNILLIDDVFTSGATLDACARTLKKSGAATVNVLTIARVTKDEF